MRVEDPYRYVVLQDGTELGCKRADHRHRRHRARAGRTGRRAADRRRHLLRSGAHRGSQLPRPGRVRRGRGKLGGTGRDVLLPLRQTGHHARARQQPAGQHVPVSDRPDQTVRPTSMYRLARRSRKYWATIGWRTLRSNTTAARRKRCRRPRCFCSSAPCPTRDLVREVVACNNAGFVLTGQDLLKDGKRPAGWQLNRDPYLLETSVPGIFCGR